MRYNPMEIQVEVNTSLNQCFLAITLDAPVRSPKNNPTQPTINDISNQKTPPQTAAIVCPDGKLFPSDGDQSKFISGAFLLLSSSDGRILLKRPFKRRYIPIAKRNVIMKTLDNSLVPKQAHHTKNKAGQAICM